MHREHFNAISGPRKIKKKLVKSDIVWHDGVKTIKNFKTQAIEKGIQIYIFIL